MRGSVDVLQIIKAMNEFNLNYRIKNNLIIVKYSRKGIKGSAVLPKKLKLTQNTVVCVGLHDGDGYNTTGKNGQNSRIAFTNTNIKYHKMVLKWFEKINLKRENFTIRLSIPHEHLENERILKQIWSKELGIDKFWNTCIIDGDLPAGSIYYNNSFLRNFLDRIKTIIRSYATKNAKYARWYLMGIYATEGSTWMGNRGITPVIRISYNSKREKRLAEIYEKCLKKLDIKYFDKNDGRGLLTICGVSKAWELLNLGFFDLKDKYFIKKKLMSPDYHYLLSKQKRNFLFNNIKIPQMIKEMKLSRNVYDWKRGKYGIPKRFLVKLCEIKGMDILDIINEIEAISFSKIKIKKPSHQFVMFTLSDFIE